VETEVDAVDGLFETTWTKNVRESSIIDGKDST
jgi:hypothetical protein